ncbi:MAG: hypothetical protein Q4C81_01005 [Kocuria sp.]|nr:hypothetical protein [Kocuria sp.]
MSRTIDVRAVSPEFRVTRGVYVVLIGASVLLAMLLGLSIALAAFIGPALLEFFGPIERALPMVLRGISVLFLVHHVLSMSGQVAREVSAPADAAILAHAGCTRGQVVTARLLIPIMFETGIMVVIFALCGGLAIQSWGLPVDAVMPSLGLGMGLTVSAACARATSVCVLATRRVSPALIRSVGWAIIAAGAGAITTGILLPAFFGPNDLQSTVHMTLIFLLSPEGTTVLIAVTATLLLMAAATTVWLWRQPWDEGLVDYLPTGRPASLPLPRSAWWRLVALPLTVIRDPVDSEAGDFLLSARAAFWTGAFGIGAFLGGRLDPIFPIEAAWGLAVGGSIVAAGLTHGICSANAWRLLLPQLTVSQLGERGTAGALVCSNTLLCAPFSVASLPLILLTSNLPMNLALTAWFVGVLTVPGITVFVDCLFPARLPAESNGRVRQHPVASLLGAALALACGVAAYAASQAGISPFVVLMACVTVTSVFILTVRFPRGVN